MIGITDSSKKEVDQFYDPFYAGRICKECGQNHGYRPNFEGVKTSLDVIPELIEFMIFIENSILRTTLNGVSGQGRII